MTDLLYEARNFFYIGAFQACVKEGQVNTKTDEEKLEKDVYLYRAYIGLGKTAVVLSEVPESISEPALKAVRLLAQSVAQPQQQSRISSQALSLAENTADNLALVVLGTILLNDKNYDEAYKALKKASSLEACSLLVQVLLAMNRFDLALKSLKKMQETDEDATLTQITLAWLYICNGREKLQDAFYIYQELIDKFGATPSLLTSQAAVHILKGEYSEAESLLQQAEEKDAGSAVILINQFFLCGALHKGDEAQGRLLTQLKADHGHLDWVKEYAECERVLDEWEE